MLTVSEKTCGQPGFSTKRLIKPASSQMAIRIQAAFDLARTMVTSAPLSLVGPDCLLKIKIADGVAAHDDKILVEKIGGVFHAARRPQGRVLHIILYVP